MVASKDTSQDSVTGHRSGDGDTAAVEQLVDGAARLWLRAPELALALGQHAAGLAEAAGADDVWLRAETVVVDARVRLGYRACTVGRAVAALRLAEDAGQAAMAAGLRANLAVCARSVGSPLTGLAVLRPALTTEAVPGTVRAFALTHLVGCMGRLGRAPGLVRVLAEADRLCTADENAEDDARLVARALVRVAVSAFRRRHADLVGAADAARKGLALLDELNDSGADGGVARVRLVLELVCSLLDLGHTSAALDIAQPLLDEPPRAAGVAPVGWLRLAVATRVHLPGGDTSAAARLLREAVHSSTRHELHALTARLWLELAAVEERLNLPGEALRCMQQARAAEQAHVRVRRQACAVLTGEFGAGEQTPVELEELLAGPRRTTPSLPPVAGTPRTDREAAITATVQAGLPQRSSVPTPQPVTQDAVPPEPVGSERAAADTADTADTVDVADTADTADTVDVEPRTTPAAAATPRESPVSSDSEVSSLSQAVGGRRARHDTQHGSLAARSVLDRLGITASGSGGRRRAADDETAGSETAGHETGPAASGEPQSRVEAMSAPEPEPRSTPVPASTQEFSSAPQTESEPRGDLTAEPETKPESEPKPEPEDTGAAPGERKRLQKVSDEWVTPDPFGEHDSVSDPWLPKLRLPPSLDSIAGLDLDPDPGATDSGSDIDDGYQAALAADEPPPGAGLADLLARALAEHRAGSSSASALVKRLGDDKSDFDEPRRINGRHRTDD